MTALVVDAGSQRDGCVLTYEVGRLGCVWHSLAVQAMVVEIPLVKRRVVAFWITPVSGYMYAGYI